MVNHDNDGDADDNLQGNSSEQISMGKSGSGSGQEGHQDWKAGQRDGDGDGDADGGDDHEKMSIIMIDNRRISPLFFLNPMAGVNFLSWGPCGRNGPPCLIRGQGF